jgi:hypothetical protein
MSISWASTRIRADGSRPRIASISGGVIRASSASTSTRSGSRRAIALITSAADEPEPTTSLRPSRSISACKASLNSGWQSAR